MDIEALLDEYTQTDAYEGWTGHNDPDPRAISGGLCGEFAEFVAERTSGVRTMSTADVLGVPADERPDPWHVWVTDGNRHYDAEAPDGVPAWTQLPFFRRNL